MNKEKITELGNELYLAMRANKTLQPLTEREPEITIEDAYHISRVMLDARLEGDGERVIGKKIGVTSSVVQEMLGVYQPDFGFLTDAMEYPNNASIKIDGNMIQPLAEAEIAFRLKADLIGPGITEADVLSASESIMPCFEIVDSRIDDWKVKIQDTVADNASCGVYVLGEDIAVNKETDFPALDVKVYKNGEFLSEGKGRAVQGNPLTAVAWLANTLGEFGIPLKAGETILSGSVVPMEKVKAGDEMHMELTGLGSATVRFV
jgi:2-oxopent-4-enoate/cis-2-oxohex-4-enoate hydratase